MATYTQAWKLVEPRLGTQPIDSISTTQNHPLGTIVRAQETANSNGEGEFVYCVGVASCAAGEVVGVNPDDFSITRAVADGIYPLVGVAIGALVASSYGWVQISGKAVAKVLASFADNAQCYLTSTAGSIDDAVVAGDYIHGMKGASAIDAPATGYAEVELNRAHTTDGPTV